MYHALSVPSTYCQPKMSFEQLNFQICVEDWGGGCCNGAGYLKYWRNTHPNQDLQPPSTSGTQPSMSGTQLFTSRTQSSVRTLMLVVKVKEKKHTLSTILLSHSCSALQLKARKKKMRKRKRMMRRKRRTIFVYSVCVWLNILLSFIPFQSNFLIGKTEIGEGRVAPRTRYIDQHLLLDSEVKVQLTRVNFKKKKKKISS